MQTHKNRSARWLVRAVVQVIVCASCFAACGQQFACGAAAVGPNVVVIVIDDLGWTDLSCYGSRFDHTPAIDRLAAEGMRFTQAYAACPVCSPTRAALMTGKYPARLHLTDFIPGNRNFARHRLLRPEFRQELPLEEITIAEQLHAAGYATAQIGKWHLGGTGFEPTRQGFNVGIAGDAAGSPRSYLAPYVGRDGRAIPGLENAAPEEYLTDRLTGEAEKFIEQNRARPFFLYLPQFAVHTPLVAKAEKVARYKAASKPPGLQTNPIYAAMIESVDESVGRIVQKLEALGLADNTLMIFTSDNGGLATVEGPHTPATNNAPLREGKGYLYEGGIRVPLIVKWPGHFPPGNTSSEVVSSIDLPLTIAAACGAAWDTPVDGVSLVDVLEKGKQLAERPLYWHYPHYSNQGGKPGGAVRQGNFKLIEFYEDGRRELFDLAADPSEAKNLVAEQPERAAEMAGQLAAWRKAVDAHMLSPNPQYQPDTQAADGNLTLVAATADIHGVMVRYEPLPHKNTIGFWTRADDWVSWEFDVERPGVFEIEILQGCGPGSGGSQVEFAIGDQRVTATVEETGGFQQFVARRIGTIELARAGRHTLTVKPRSKPGAAVMDLRQVRLLEKAASKAK